MTGLQIPSVVGQLHAAAEGGPDRAAQVAQPVRLVRLGLLGCAEFAVRRMLPAVAQTTGLQLTAVASRQLEKAADLAGQYDAQPVAGYDRLLGREDVDAVYIPLPTALHAQWVEAALLAGKHVLAEKPLSATHAESVRLHELARSRGLVLRENVLFPHHSQHAAVRQLVQDGAVGSPHTFASTFSIPPRPEQDIRYRPELGGGALYDLGGYPVRAALYLLGPDLELVGATLRRDPRRGVDLGGSVLLRSAAGVGAQLAFGLDGAYRTDYEICGTAGRIRLDRAFTPPADHAPQLTFTHVDGRTEERRLTADDQCGNAVRAFAEAVRAAADGGLAAVGEDPALDGDSLRAAALLDQIRACAR